MQGEDKNYLLRLQQIREKYQCTKPTMTNYTTNSMTQSHQFDNKYEPKKPTRQPLNRSQNSLNSRELARSMYNSRSKYHQIDNHFQRKSPNVSKQNYYNPQTKIYTEKSNRKGSYLDTFQRSHDTIKNYPQKCSKCQSYINLPSKYQEPLIGYEPPIITKTYNSKLQSKESHEIPNSNYFKNKFSKKIHVQQNRRGYNLDSLNKLQQKIQFTLKH